MCFAHSHLETKQKPQHLSYNSSGHILCRFFFLSFFRPYPSQRTQHKGAERHRKSRLITMLNINGRQMFLTRGVNFYLPCKFHCDKRAAAHMAPFADSLKPMVSYGFLWFCRFSTLRHCSRKSMYAPLLACTAFVLSFATPTSAYCTGRLRANAKQNRLRLEPQRSEHGKVGLSALCIFLIRTDVKSFRGR